MAGYTAPKDPSQRARRNKPATPSHTFTVTTFAPPTEPPLDLLPDDEQWHSATLRWWSRWAESPLAATLPEVDWSELEATAVLHHEFMKKRSFTLASELRLRMQQFGSTPEARMKLRILIAEADTRDPHDAKISSGGARGRFGNLAVVPAVGE